MKGLAENLDILSRVVRQANHSLRERGEYGARPRWDPETVDQIIGDYQETLRECYTLIDENKRYNLSRGQTSGPLRNIEWNVLVQPSVDRLRQRIILHNSKILHFLKPFEM